MPFQNKPSGFSPQSLRLLDVALTRMWVEQLVIGAIRTGANSDVLASLKEKKRRLDELGMQRRADKATRSEK